MKEPQSAGPCRRRELGGLAVEFTHGGVDRQSFELYALAASIVGQCEFCVRSHYKLLQETGLTTQQLRDVGRIAAVINAAAQVLAAEATREEPIAA